MIGVTQLLGQIVSISALNDDVNSGFSVMSLVLSGSDGRGEIEIHVKKEQARGYAPGDEFVLRLDMSGIR